jgi:hypothetical protein
LREKRQIKILNERVQRGVAFDEDCRRLLAIPGYGPMIVSALVSAICNGAQFRQG